MNPKTRRLTARWIIPVSGAPINGGSVQIDGDRIVEVARGPAPQDAEDLGDVALLPALVNAHTHLEFSDCRQPIGQSGVALARWIGQVVAARGGTSIESRRKAIELGLQELRDCGTSLAGEITTPPCDYPDSNAGPELVTFAEVLGLDADRARERLEASLCHSMVHADGGWSPHAPYSTSIQSIEACVQYAREYDRPVAMHVAESPDERELLCNGTGPFADTLRELGAWREGLFPWSGDPFETLIDRLARAPRALLIHGNDLNDAEIQRLRRHDNLTVVHCPRTHHFFGYQPHPVDLIVRAGVRVALGTDSRASNPDLNLWREVQFLLRNRTDLNPADVVAMATMHGADALGRHDLGRIEVAARARFGSIATTATTIESVYADFATREFTVVV